jgi:serine/threonine protein kinase
LGNVLQSYKTYISDFGFCRPADEDLDKKRIYGVMPYMEPELLRGKGYTQKSDLYSLGMTRVTLELTTEVRLSSFHANAF